MLDPEIFPELDRFKVEDGVRNIIEGYSFIERVLLYRSLKSQGSYSHVLVYIIPNKESLIKTKDPGYRASRSFEYGFNTHAGLDEVFRDAALHGNGYQCVGVEASSEKDEALNPYIVDGSNHWVLYEKHPQGTDIGDEQMGQGAKEEMSLAPKISDFDKSLMAFAKIKRRNNPSLSVPDIARQALREKEDFLFLGRYQNGKQPKQETIEKHLRKLQKQQK